jgi:transposase
MSLEHGAVRPRFAKIAQAVQYCGLSRSRLYELGGKHRGLIKKQGRTSLVDIRALDQILDALPPADLKAPSPRA